MNNEIAEYYNTILKHELDPPFEQLSDEDALTLKKLIEPSFGFATWKLNKACNLAEKQFKIACEKLLVAFRLN